MAPGTYGRAETQKVARTRAVEGRLPAGEVSVTVLADSRMVEILSGDLFPGWQAYCRFLEWRRGENDKRSSAHLAARISTALLTEEG